MASTVEDQAQRVVEALKAKPELLHQVMRELRQVRVLAPWHMSNADRLVWYRHDPEGQVWASVWQDNGSWQWRAKRLAQLGKASTLVEARDAVDAVLASKGWILAP